MRRKKDKPSSPPPPPDPTPVRRIGHPTRKRLGEAMEAAFLARAATFNFDISKPWGESYRYDMVVNAGYGFLRVQVKCTERYAESRYRVSGAGCNDAYTADEIDFIAAYIIPENIWYIVPIHAFASHKSLRFYPRDGRKSKYEKYREAWCLLASKPTARGRRDLPKTCRCPDLPIRCSVCPNRTSGRAAL